MVEPRSFVHEQQRPTVPNDIDECVSDLRSGPIPPAFIRADAPAAQQVPQRLSLEPERHWPRNPAPGDAGSVQRIVASVHPGGVEMKVSRGPVESVREWLRTWNTVDRDGFFDLLSPRFVGRGVMAPQGVDGEAMWNMMVAFRGTFPDIRWELGDWLVTQGDIAVCHLFESGTFTGRWPDPDRLIEPTSRPYRSEAVMLFRFDADGQIVENQSWYDSVDWFHQIGVDPNVGAPQASEAIAELLVPTGPGG
jgi:hypothetical protein